ncbi:MAG: polysaccharide pyruvyl transferase family protein [Paracoccaceae bacterium]|jgi:hypothetical protein|nr:polysaccharide pyruvyl transferase family protein [Paracoccaceae bacterium]
MTPIRLFWYRREANFGDALSPLVVAHVSGRPVEWAPKDAAGLFACGSLMRMVAAGVEAPREPRPVVWGTGCMGPVERGFLDRVDVALLRGPVTAALLERADTRFGDPGLLAAEAVGGLPARDDKVGIVPHLTKRNDPALAALAAAEPRVEVIDPTGEPADVVRRIAGCAYVLSSSLHGLVVADACGVPNDWLEPWGQHAHAALKFHDYAASVGRALGAPLAVADIPARINRPLPHAIRGGAAITEAQHALRDTFPAHLRAAQAAA